MTDSASFHPGPGDWDFDAVLLNDPHDGGLVLKDVKHHNYQMASDIRVVSVWVGSKDGAIKPYHLGSRHLPNITSIRKNTLPRVKLFAPYPQLLELSTQFKTPNPVIGTDKDSQQLSITQRYVFTSYGNKPGHEPSENLRAARLYPFVEFSYTGKPKETKPLTYLRIDYRIEVSVEMGLAIMPWPFHLGGYSPFALGKPGHSKGKLQLQQAGVFQDIEKEPSHLSVAAKIVLPTTPSPITDIFSAGEKPLPTEMIGWGVRHGQPAEWDNIHIWGYNNGILPATPGMNHGLHIHWRWGTVAAKETPAPFYGLGAPQFSPRGAGRPMIDSNIVDQNLRFAITGDERKQTNGPWRASDHSTTKNFDEQFTSTGNPLKISDGAPIVLWICVEAFRPDHENDSTLTWKGSFFQNGMYFAHDSELIPKAMSILGLDSPLNKPGTSTGWYRPKKI